MLLYQTNITSVYFFPQRSLRPLRFFSNFNLGLYLKFDGALLGDNW